MSGFHYPALLHLR